MSAGFRLGLAAAAMAALLAAASSAADAQQTAGGITVGDSDLGGVVRSAKGPEAGVWVIAETTDLPTKFAKIVVTDDQGRYVLPELPKATYSVWVRGYGLVDSAKVRATPGKILDLTAVTAPTPAAAAEYYPAQWWYSMMRIPDKSLFPGTGPKGNGMAANMRSQAMWLANIKSQGCGSCHQLGNKPTRVIDPKLGKFDSSFAAWTYRMQVGPAAEIMIRNISQLDSQHALEEFRRLDRPDRRRASCRNRSRRGPPGVERNVVDHAVGLGHADGLSARRGRHRPAQPDGQRQRQDLRRDRGFDRPRAGARSGHPHHDAGQALHPHAGQAARHVHLAA